MIVWTIVEFKLPLIVDETITERIALTNRNKLSRWWIIEKRNIASSIAKTKSHRLPIRTKLYINQKWLWIIDVAIAMNREHT